MASVLYGYMRGCVSDEVEWGQQRPLGPRALSVLPPKLALLGARCP